MTKERLKQIRQKLRSEPIGLRWVGHIAFELIRAIEKLQEENEELKQKAWLLDQILKQNPNLIKIK